MYIITYNCGFFLMRHIPLCTLVEDMCARLIRFSDKGRTVLSLIFNLFLDAGHVVDK